MIQIKTLFGEWKEVTKEQAKDCVMLRVYNLLYQLYNEQGNSF